MSRSFGLCDRRFTFSIPRKGFVKIWSTLGRPGPRRLWLLGVFLTFWVFSGSLMRRLPTPLQRGVGSIGVLHRQMMGVEAVQELINSFRSLPGLK